MMMRRMRLDVRSNLPPSHTRVTMIGPVKEPTIIMEEPAFKHGGEFALRQVGSESILVPIRNSVGDLDSVFTLNEVASRVWGLLNGQQSLDAIVEIICDEYDVT